MRAIGNSQEDAAEKESPLPPVTSLLDRDIIDLFTPSESGSQEDLKEVAVVTKATAAPLPEVSCTSKFNSIK